MNTSWIREEGEGVTLRLRVLPNASRDKLEGIETSADGHEHLKVRVRAVPDKGAANGAVIRLLAKALGVPRSAVALVSGHAARIKTVRVAGVSRGQAEEKLARPSAPDIQPPPTGV